MRVAGVGVVKRSFTFFSSLVSLVTQRRLADLSYFNKDRIAAPGIIDFRNVGIRGLIIPIRQYLTPKLSTTIIADQMYPFSATVLPVNERVC
ncbi:hypothetical protein TNCV_1054501 [Trichonephila clavipes]|nr:hypothetical protein TNCV_1054501 [Trichonephila clavipes]